MAQSNSCLVTTTRMLHKTGRQAPDYHQVWGPRLTHHSRKSLTCFLLAARPFGLPRFHGDNIILELNKARATLGRLCSRGGVPTVSCLAFFDENNQAEGRAVRASVKPGSTDKNTLMRKAVMPASQA